jgi:hypothetical protein
MSRLLMIVTLPTTSLGLLAVTFHSLILDDGPVPWEGLKLLVCAVLLATNLLAFSLVFFPIVSRPSPRLAAIAGGFQIALGALAFAWTIHLATTTGDFEGPIATLAGLVAFQGFLLLAHVVPSQSRTAPSY